MQVGEWVVIEIKRNSLSVSLPQGPEGKVIAARRSSGILCSSLHQIGHPVIYPRQGIYEVICEASDPYEVLALISSHFTENRVPFLATRSETMGCLDGGD